MWSAVSVKVSGPLMAVPAPAGASCGHRAQHRPDALLGEVEIRRVEVDVDAPPPVARGDGGDGPAPTERVEYRVSRCAAREDAAPRQLLGERGEVRAGVGLGSDTPNRAT